MGRSSCRVLPLLWTSVCAASLLACLVDARPTIQLRTKPHHRSSRNTTTVAFQPFCWDALNEPVEELIEQPVSAEADGFKALRTALATLPLQQKRSCHKLALLVPYRNRPQHLEDFLPRMHAYLTAEKVNFDIIIVEQSPNYRFNRGLLLNAGVLLTHSLDHDYYVFNDVDTVPAKGSGIHYTYPEGARPLHITPPGMHPKYAHAEQFFGGIAAFSREQILAVNGHGTEFWGWGKEDDNLRERFIKARRWPPQRATGMEGQGPVWFDHLEHEQAPQIMSTVENGTQRYAEGVVFSGEAANESMMDDLDSGLNTTSFCVSGVEAIEHLAVKVSMELYCNRAQSPWCLQAYDLQKN